MIQQKNKESLAVIIPMYNEEKIAAMCIDSVIRVLEKLPIPTKLIVVNDGSTDGTASILKEKSRTYNNYLIVETHKENKGYGSASQSGIDIAQRKRFEWCLHMDSDLTNNPKYINEFVKYISSDYDCIKASRYVKGGKVMNVPFFRRIISLVGNLIAYYLFAVKIKDCTNGFRMIRLSKLKGIKLKENNFSIILEELYYLKKRRCKFKEIPNILTVRTNSKSRFGYKPEIFFDYFKYAFKSAFVLRHPLLKSPFESREVLIVILLLALN